MRSILKSAAIAATALALSAPSALADGLPVLGVDVGSSGVTSGDLRYVTITTARGTVVAVTARRGGQVVRTNWLPRQYTIPAVSLDGTAAGLSHDGRTLMLIKPRVRFPQSETRMAVLSTKSLRVRRELVLDGDFSFDALAPDGRTAYVIHYTSRRDYTRYEVLSLDLGTGRLNPEPIVDPRPEEADEVMRGLPLSRATSRDGRWAYTLYDGNGKHPFVHALDTVGRVAYCIDLHDLEGRDDIMGLHLVLDGGVLAVTAPGEGRVLEIDAKTMKAHAPGAQETESEEAVPAARSGSGGGSGGVPWAAVAGLAGFLAVAASLAVRRRRRQTAYA